jgi:uncharacterized membrane protein YfcA
LKQFSDFDTPLVLRLVPAAILGTIVDKELTQILPDGVFFRIVQITLLLLSLKLIADWIVTLAA